MTSSEYFRYSYTNAKSEYTAPHKTQTLQMYSEEGSLGSKATQNISKYFYTVLRCYDKTPEKCTKTILQGQSVKYLLPCFPSDVLLLRVPLPGSVGRTLNCYNKIKTCVKHKSIILTSSVSGMASSARMSFA